MKTTAMTVLMVMTAAGTNVCAARNQNGILTAYTTDDRNQRRHSLLPAEMLAARMFAAAGFELKWREGAPAHPPAPSDLAFVITVVDDTPADRTPGVLAFAQVFEGVHLAIYYDRIAALSKDGADTVLAHVLVHELTHLLQGLDRHSDSGVMKLHYTRADLFDMTIRPLPFTNDDLVLINVGVAHRLRAGAIVARTSALVGSDSRDVNR